MGRRRGGGTGRRGGRPHRERRDHRPAPPGRRRGGHPGHRGGRLPRRSRSGRRAVLRRGRDRHGHPLPAHLRQHRPRGGQGEVPGRSGDGRDRHHRRGRPPAPDTAHRAGGRAGALGPVRLAAPGGPARRGLQEGIGPGLGADDPRRPGDEARQGTDVEPGPAGRQHPDAAQGLDGRRAHRSRGDGVRSGRGADRRSAVVRRTRRPRHGGGGRHAPCPAPSPGALRYAGPLGEVVTRRCVRGAR